MDLNPLRAALAETLAESDFTSVQRRIQALPETQLGAPQPASEPENPTGVSPDSRETGARGARPSPDRFLAPLTSAERAAAPGVRGDGPGTRCSDKGFLPRSVPEYLELLDWTARQTVAGPRNIAARSSRAFIPFLGRAD